MAHGVLDRQSQSSPLERPLGLALPASYAGLRRAALACVPAGILFLAVFPYAAWFVINHPDERHYRDAGIGMLHSGDYLTPRTPELPLRLRKPILTYWFVAAGYHVAGVTPLGSRVMFLLASCAIVGLTYRLAWRLFECRRTAVLAAIITACNAAVVTCAHRSMPDVPWALFLVISAYGFLGIAKSGSLELRWLLLAYVGTGLAIATRGLPGVVFLVLGMLFVGLHPGLKRCQRALDHLPWLALCALVAGSWYVLMCYLHGDALWDELKEDQISNRLDRPFWKPAVQLPQYAMLLAASFLPWLIPLVRRGNRLREFWASTDSGRRRGMLLIFLWSGLYLLMAANVERVNLRYLLPVVPLLAPLAAAWLVAAGEQVNGRWMAHVLRLALVLLVLVGVAAAVVGVWFSDPLPGLVGAAMAALLAAALWRLSQGRSWFAQAQLLNVSLLALLPVGFLCMKPVALPDVGQRIHEELTLLQAYHAKEIHFFGKAAVASRLRLLTQGSVPIHNRPWFHTARASQWPVLVLIDTRVDRLNLVGYDLHRFTHGYHRLPLGGAAQAFCQGRLSEYLARHERPIVIATARPLAAVAR